jgi:hypothetical protein
MSAQAKTLSIALVANQPATVQMTGTYLRCLSGDDMTIELGTRESDFAGQLPFAAGRYVRVNSGFETVRLLSTTNQTVTLLAIFGDYGDDSLIISSSVAVNTKPQGLTMTTEASVSALAGATTLLNAGNSGRRFIGLFNEGTENLYIRETSATAKSPLVLSPGAFLPVPVTSAIYAYNPGLTACTVLMAEFE